MIINPSDATYQLEMSCHNLQNNSWLGFSEVESKPAVLSEVNRKVKAKSSTVDNARTKAATQRPQKPLQQKGKLSHLILWITHILKKSGQFLQRGAVLCMFVWVRLKQSEEVSLKLDYRCYDMWFCLVQVFQPFTPLHQFPSSPYFSCHIFILVLTRRIFFTN